MSSNRDASSLLGSTAHAPMTLGNMRENGVRNHEKIVNVDAYGDDLLVTSFGPRIHCERCGQRGADVRPNWNETAPPSLFGVP